MASLIDEVVTSFLLNMLYPLHADLKGGAVRRDTDRIGVHTCAVPYICQKIKEYDDEI